jgi:hypothetical protein
MTSLPAGLGVLGRLELLVHAVDLALIKSQEPGFRGLGLNQSVEISVCLN